MKLNFLGDTHGPPPLEAMEQETIQVGDLNIGIPTGILGQGLVKLDDKIDFGKMRFIRGNHDCPNLCRRHPAYLGDWNVIEIEDGRSILVVSGAKSSDKYARTEGFDYWEEEELSILEASKMLQFYQIFTRTRKIEAVVSHDCPSSILPILRPTKQIEPSRTNQFLQAVLEMHAPKIWVFGHHHISWQQKVGETEFHCLGIMELKSIEI